MRLAQGLLLVLFKGAFLVESRTMRKEQRVTAKSAQILTVFAQAIDSSLRDSLVTSVARLDF